MVMDSANSDYAQIKEGDIVMLKPDALPYVKIRDWYVYRFENGKIMLRCLLGKNYTLEVILEDIEKKLS